MAFVLWDLCVDLYLLCVVCVTCFACSGCNCHRSCTSFLTACIILLELAKRDVYLHNKYKRKIYEFYAVIPKEIQKISCHSFNFIVEGYKFRQERWRGTGCYGRGHYFYTIWDVVFYRSLRVMPHDNFTVAQMNSRHKAPLNWRILYLLFYI